MIPCLRESPEDNLDTAQTEPERQEVWQKRKVRWEKAAPKDHASLSGWQRFVLWWSGRIIVAYEILAPKQPPTEIYLTTCSVHGLFEDYPHTQERLDCPYCAAEHRRSTPAPLKLVPQSR